MDIRLYNIPDTGDSSKISVNTELLETSILSLPPAYGMECIANKVVKYMLTHKGTDALDLSYGSSLPELRVIDTRMLARIQMDLVVDLQNCANFIKRNEDTYTSPKLGSLSLVRIVYDPEKAKDAFHVFIQIITTTGESALLDIPSWVQG